MNPLLLGMLPELFGLGKEIINRTIADPAQKAGAEMELMKMTQEGQLKEVQIRMAAIMAEASSADRWTSRARPMFLYVFYVLICFMTVVAPLLGVFFPDHMDLFFHNVGRGFAAIPEELWWTFSVGYLGYSGIRSFEKHKGVAK